MTHLTLSARNDLNSGIRRLCRESKAIAEHSDREAEFPRSLYQQAGQIGVLSLAADRDPRVAIEWYGFLSKLSTAWLTFGEIVHLAGMSISLLSEFHRGEEQAELIVKLSRGEGAIANCVSEPGARSDVGAISSLARKVAGGYEITGTKIWAGLAPVAEHLLVYARTSAHPLGGLTCFLVDVDADGVLIGNPYDKAGARALPAGEVSMSGTFVSSDRIVGRLNRGAVVLQSHLVRGRLGIAACAVGLTERILSECVSFAHSRKQFGVPISDHQLVKGQLADIYTRSIASRALMNDAASRVASGEMPSASFVNGVKLLCTRNAVESANIGAELFSAEGQELFSFVARSQRDAMLLQIIEGTPNILADNIAKGLN
jgi:alkylation response protein AidB-like acyl-CoA dehydrogenase